MTGENTGQRPEICYFKEEKTQRTHKTSAKTQPRGSRKNTKVHKIDKRTEILGSETSSTADGRRRPLRGHSGHCPRRLVIALPSLLPKGSCLLCHLFLLCQVSESLCGVTDKSAQRHLPDSGKSCREWFGVCFAFRKDVPSGQKKSPD